MHLDASIQRVQNLLEINDPYALANWLVHDLSVAVANDMWHVDLIPKIAKISPVTDATSCHHAAKAINAIAVESATLPYDSYEGGADYKISLGAELVPIQMALQITHGDTWPSIKNLVNACQFLTSMAADRQPTHTH